MLVGIKIFYNPLTICYLAGVKNVHLRLDVMSVKPWEAAQWELIKSHILNLSVIADLRLRLGLKRRLA